MYEELDLGACIARFELTAADNYPDTRQRMIWGMPDNAPQIGQSRRIMLNMGDM